MNLNQKEIKKLLQKEDPTILELGAHKGFDTIRFLNEFTNLKIYCFEPDPRCISGFKSMVSDGRCSLIEAAVSNKDGETVLYMSGGYNPGRFCRIYSFLKKIGLVKLLEKGKTEWDLSSTIKSPISNSKMYPWMNFNKTVVIRTIRLDTWTKKNNINYIDLIWSDIQGAEREMIEGATCTLKNVRYIFTEYGETDSYPEAMTRDETIGLLQKHNFEIITKYSSKGKRGDLLFRNRDLL